MLGLRKAPGLVMAEEASPNARRNVPLTATNLPSASEGPSAVVERFGTAVIKALARQSNAEAAQTTPSEPPRALDENQLIAPTKAPETQVSEQALAHESPGDASQ